MIDAVPEKCTVLRFNIPPKRARSSCDSCQERFETPSQGLNTLLNSDKLTDCHSSRLLGPFVTNPIRLPPDLESGFGSGLIRNSGKRKGLSGTIGRRWMALYFYTDDAQALLDSFNARMDQKEAKG